MEVVPFFFKKDAIAHYKKMLDSVRDEYVFDEEVCRGMAREGYICCAQYDDGDALYVLERKLK
jgi:hypothetical protein